MIDATLKANMLPLALPREEFMVRAKGIWEELQLPRLTPQSPWHGYELGDWSEQWTDYAKRAVAGDWETNGSMTENNQKGGMKPETQSVTSRNEPDKPSEPKLGPKFHSDWFRAVWGKFVSRFFWASYRVSSLIGTSAPYLWMLGAMFANIIASLIRLPVAGPNRLRPLVAIVIGVMLGSSFTPALFDRITLWAPSLIFMVGYLIVAALVVVPFYRKIAGFDLSTAYFAGMPGGLMEMMIIGKDAGADERSIILAHTSRIVLVVTLVAIWFRVVQGIDLSDRSQFGIPFSEIPEHELIILAIVGAFGYFLGRFLHLPAPMLLGPIIVSAAVYSLGIIHNPPPRELVIIAQIFLGTIVGCRFSEPSLRQS